MRTAATVGALVGQSPALRTTLRQISAVAATDAPVLITGESGTGKELVARALHASGKRRRQPLSTVNCAAIPRELFESEFFGHARGAFSGAVHDRGGRFQAAHGATLFLDEVTEFPPELQGKLLRVLEDGRVQRLGDDRERRVDVRVISATNRVVTDELRTGRLRMDLYYRLAVFQIDVPPLRERREDIPILLAHFLQHLAPDLHERLTISDAARRQLAEYDWPGNVRELINVIERALLLSEGDELRFDLALAHRGAATARPGPPPLQSSTPALTTTVLSQQELDRLERDNIIAALLKTHWKISGPQGAATLLGVKPSTLTSRIKRLGLKPIAPAIPAATDQSA